jgi:hypothetical protein
MKYLCALIGFIFIWLVVLALVCTILGIIIVVIFADDIVDISHSLLNILKS